MPFGPSTNSENTAATVASEIRADIIRGELPPGAKLKVRELVSRYRVGAIPLREALSRLSTSGFVTAEHQRGFRVADVSAEDFLDLTDARIFIECGALRRSIEQGDLEWEGQLLSAHHRLSRLALMSSSGEGIDHDWALAHASFHGALLAGCKSRWLLSVASTLRDQTERYRNLSVIVNQSTGDAPRDVAAEHEAMAKAALARDATTACALLREHLERTATLALQTGKLQQGAP